MKHKHEFSALKGQAAVLLALRGSGAKQQLLLTRRAEHLNIHRGEVAFPGGKWEQGDSSLMFTALRESHEEVGLLPDSVEVIGQLKACPTRAGMLVTPFVGLIPEHQELFPNPEELESLFWVPVDFFIRDQRARTDIFRWGDQEEWAPVYEWQGYKIWGFTARVIVTFMNQYVGMNIDRENNAIETVYKK